MSPFLHGWPYVHIGFFGFLTAFTIVYWKVLVPSLLRANREGET